MKSIVKLTPLESLKLQGEIFDFNLRGIELPEIIDVESFDELWNKIKQFLRWLKEQFIKLAKFVKEKLLRWFRSLTFEKQLDKITWILSTGYITNLEFTDAIKSVLIKSELSIEGNKEDKIVNYLSNFNDSDLDSAMERYMDRQGGLGNYWLYLFNREGKLRDPVMISSRIKRVVEDIWNLSRDNLYKKYNIIENERLSSLVVHFTKHCLDIPSDISVSQPVNVNYFIDVVKQFNNMFDVTLKDSNKTLENINRLLNTVIDKNDNLENWIKIEKITLMKQCAMILVNYYSYLSRLISGLTGVLFSDKYTLTTEIHHQDLYHISDNPHLPNILKPTYPKKGTNQNLQPRISFSPTPLQRCYGVSNYFPITGKVREWNKIPLYLYKGLPIKGKTKYLKPELVLANIDGGEYLLSSECCVVSPIEISNIGELKVEYNGKIDYYTPGRYINVEYV